MTCPVCGGAVKVLDCCTDCESVYRRRKCLECDAEFFTTESETPTSQADFNAVKNEYNRELKRAKVRKEKISHA